MSSCPARSRIRAWLRRHLPRRLAARVLGLATLAVTEAGAAEQATPHWAFAPLRPELPPAVRDVAWPKTDLDRFILAPLEAAGKRPGDAADARALVRRMTFDLTGLPPTVEEVEQLTAAAGEGHREQALSGLMERLLGSPHYGERWGRHWLDVARYSDTKGYVYGREERRFVHAPTYRDWVIRAFNEDLPYDRFLLLQLAADQLVPPGSPDLAAMGFLTGGRRFIGVTHDIIDDRIDVVTRGTMALTVQCARCHDHKYDPIPIEDYYSLYGVFHAAEDRLVPLRASDDPELAKRQSTLAATMTQRRAEAAARLRSRVADYLAAQLELQKYPEEGFDQILSTEDVIPASVRRWRDYLHTTRDPAHPLFGPWHLLAALDPDAFAVGAEVALAPLRKRGGLNPRVAAVFETTPASMREVAERYGRLFGNPEPDEHAPGVPELRAFLADPRSPTAVPDTGIVNNEGYFPLAVTEELWRLQGDVDRRLLELVLPAALVLGEQDPGPNPRVFHRGSPSRLGEEVPRRFLSVVSGPERVPFREGSGRLEMARAIVDPANPLTARVMVNRIWQHHFGAGLVRTPSDFGRRAPPPSHPGLLDWLAQRFIDAGWSVKAMQRLILSSAVYQQAGAARLSTDLEPATGGGGAADREPDRTGTEASEAETAALAWLPLRRLDFEQLRDAMLAVTGELNRTLGGPPVGLLESGNRRRTVYAMVDRQFLPGVLRTFDFANPDIHVAVRHETTVPQQALFFLNGQFAADRARALAGRLEEGTAPAERVRLLHRWVYQREATAREIALALRFLTVAQADAPPPPPPVVSTPWQYGAGEYDAAAGRVKTFTPLPHFTGQAWQGGADWPGGTTGWAQLTAEGGHPGNTRAHACVRRWVAARDGVVAVAGTLKHEPEAGDGVRAFVASSRHGELKTATVHHGTADLSVERIEVQAGDTLDFVVDIGGGLNSDQFLWAPVVAGIGEGAGAKADARADFNGPPPASHHLEPWEQYAQVLLLANEFAFVD